MRKALDKIEITPILKEYYNNVIKFCKQNKIPFKRIYPLGLSVDIRNIPKEKIDEWINIVSNK